MDTLKKSYKSLHETYAAAPSGRLQFNIGLPYKGKSVASSHAGTGNVRMAAKINIQTILVISVGAISLGLTGCGNPGAIKDDPQRDATKGNMERSMVQGLGGKNREEGTLFGPGGLFGTKANNKQEDGTGVAVNAYLWRASLDTINFIPLASADPFGGVIITDWYTPAETPNERMKVQVTILDRDLRADGVRVSVFKQTTSPKGGGWVDAQVDPRTNIDIENAILTRARQLRIAGGA